MSTALKTDTSKSSTTKDLILASALKIVSVHGIEGLTIGELAKSVGMSKSGLFAHFAAKDQLQLEVLKRATQHFVDVVMRPAFKAPRGEPRLIQMTENWFSYLNEESSLPGGSILIAASVELDDRPGSLRDFVQQAQRDLISNVSRATQMAIDEGHFKAGLDVDQFAWSIYSFVLGYHHFKRMLNDPKAETFYKHSMEKLMEAARKDNVNASSK